MEVILLENTESNGKIGDVVKVKAGYARNYLLPQKKAVIANSKNLRMLEKQRAEIEAHQQKLLDEARATGKKLEGIELTFTRESGEDDKLFGSVTPSDVVRELTKLSFDIERKQLVMPEAFKTLGEHQLSIRLHHDVTTTLKLQIAKKQ